MENQQNMDASSTEDRSLMNSLGQRDLRSYNDIMTRRFKNRERQRRYRARKRLEADMKKTSYPNQPTPLQEVHPANGMTDACTTRTHCRRDWKKDARSARAVKVQQLTLNGHVVPSLASAGETQTPFSFPGVNVVIPFGIDSCSKNSPSVDNSEAEKSASASGRRHWKAEARKKKN